VVHSTALNSSDNLPSYPPDNHHGSDDVYRRGGDGEWKQIHEKNTSQTGGCYVELEEVWMRKSVK